MDITGIHRWKSDIFYSNSDEQAASSIANNTGFLPVANAVPGDEDYSLAMADKPRNLE